MSADYASIIYTAAEELQGTVAGLERFVRDRATPLFGPGAALDSMGLVTLIVTVEDQISDELGRELTLADEKAMSRANSPFRTVGTLADYIAERLAE